MLKFLLTIIFCILVLEHVNFFIYKNYELLNNVATNLFQLQSHSSLLQTLSYDFLLLFASHTDSFCVTFNNAHEVYRSSLPNEKNVAYSRKESITFGIELSYIYSALRN